MLKPLELDCRRIGRALERMEAASDAVIGAGPCMYERARVADEWMKANDELLRAMATAAKNAAAQHG